MTSRQIKDLIDRGYAVTRHVGVKDGEYVYYFKIEAKMIHIQNVPKIYLPPEAGELSNFFPELKKQILN